MKKLLIILLLITSPAFGAVYFSNAPTLDYPGISAIEVDTDGTTVNITVDESVTLSGYSAGDLTLDCTTAGTVTVSSVTGSGTAYSGTASATVANGDTCTAAYDGDAYWYDADSLDIASFSGASVTNSSTQGTAGITPTFYFNADSATSGQSPQIGTGTITIDAAYTTAAGQVANALDNNDDAYDVIRIQNANIDWSIGTLGFWVNISALSGAGDLFYSATNGASGFRTAYQFGTTHRFFYGGSSEEFTLDVGWHFIEFSWDSANTRYSTRLDGGSWSSDHTTTLSSIPSGDLLLGAGPTGDTHDKLLDQIIITGGYQDDIYADRDTTSF